MYEMDKVYIRMNIDYIMKERGLQQKFIARQIGVTEETLINWKKSRTYPRLDQAVKLAELLGVGISDIFTHKNSVNPDG